MSVKDKKSEAFSYF